MSAIIQQDNVLSKTVMVNVLVDCDIYKNHPFTSLEENGYYQEKALSNSSRKKRAMELLILEGPIAMR